MVLGLLVAVGGAAAPDAGIVAEQARTIEALKAEVATLKGAGAVATPRQLTFAAEPTSLANRPSKTTYGVFDDVVSAIGLGDDDDDLPRLQYFPDAAQESGQGLDGRIPTLFARTGHSPSLDQLVMQLHGKSVRNYNTATGLTEDQCISNCLSGTWRGCVGFSRYTDQSTLDDDDNDEMTDGRTRASCWWVTRFSDGFIPDNNGARAPIPCPATPAS